LTDPEQNLSELFDIDNTKEIEEFNELKSLTAQLLLSPDDVEQVLDYMDYDTSK